MKKKMKKVIVVSLMCVAASLLAVGCFGDKGSSSTETPKAPLAERLTGFEVAAQTTVEVGEYYTPVKPDAKIDGESAFVSVSAKRGTTDLFFNGDNALLIDGFDDITLTYTVNDGEEKMEKSTVLKVQDTKAPFIVTNLFPAKLYRGDTFDCGQIRYEDLSGTVTASTLAVTDEKGTAIALDNGKFTLPENSPVQSVTFTMSATDGVGNVANKTVTLPVKDYPLWTKPFDFDSLDISKVTSEFSGTVIEEVEKDGKKVVKQSLKTPWVQGTTYWTCAHVTFPDGLSSYTYYDYIKLTVSAQTNCDIQVYGAKFEDGNGASFKAGATETKTVMYYDMQSVRELNNSVTRNDKLRFNISVLGDRDYSSLYPQKYYYVNVDGEKITVLDDERNPVDCTASVDANGGYKLEFKVSEDKTRTEYVRQTDKNGNVSTDGKYYAYSTTATAKDQKVVCDLPDMDVNFYVYDIEFGFNEREVSDESVINAAQFGITTEDVVSAKYTPTGGEAKAVNIAAFLPDENGTLELVVKKEGYRTTTVIIPIKLVQAPVQNDAANDTDAEWIW